MGDIMLGFIISLLPFIFIKDYSFIDKKKKNLYVIIYDLFILILCTVVYRSFKLSSILTNLLGLALSYKVIIDLIDGKLEKKKFNRILLGLLLFFGGSLILGVLYGMYLGWKHIPVEEAPTILNLIVECLNQFILIILFGLLYKGDLIKDFKDFKKNYSKYLRKSIPMFICAVLISEVITLILAHFTGLDTSVNEELIQGYIGSSVIISLISMGLFAPAIEELIFRKTFYDAFKYNKVLFIIASGIAFGFAHVLFSATTFNEYLFVINYILLGCALAKSYADSDNFFTSFTLHLLNNVVAVILSII